MKRVLLATLLLLTLILVGCSGQKLYLCSDGTPGGGQVPEGGKLLYICPDGTETRNIGACSFDDKITISAKDAEANAINFVNGYVRTGGWSATLINAYKEKGNYHAQVVISKSGEQSYETTVIIDGRKGTAECDQNCFYTAQLS